jgi:hypothetical protein
MQIDMQNPLVVGEIKNPAHFHSSGQLVWLQSFIKIFDSEWFEVIKIQKLPLTYNIKEVIAPSEFLAIIKYCKVG